MRAVGYRKQPQMRTDFKNVFREEFEEMKQILKFAGEVLNARRDYILD
jgi:hypothetical protein